MKNMQNAIYRVYLVLVGLWNRIMVGLLVFGAWFALDILVYTAMLAWQVYTMIHG